MCVCANCGRIFIQNFKHNDGLENKKKKIHPLQKEPPTIWRQIYSSSWVTGVTAFWRQFKLIIFFYCRFEAQFWKFTFLLRMWGEKSMYCLWDEQVNVLLMNKILNSEKEGGGGVEVCFWIWVSLVEMEGQRDHKNSETRTLCGRFRREASVRQLPSMTVRLPWVKMMYLLYETDITVLNTCQVKCVLCASSHVCTVYTLTRIHAHSHTHTHSLHMSRFIPEIKTWGHQQLWSVVYTFSVFSQCVDSIAVYRVKRKLHSMWTMLEGCLWWATLSLNLYIYTYKKTIYIYI